MLGDLSKTLWAIPILLLLGCETCGLGGKKKASAAFDSGPKSNSATLTWVAPESSVDGSPLTDLAGYKVYYSTTEGGRDKSVDVGTALTTTISDLPSGKYYFSVTAYDARGNESQASGPISKTIP